MGITVASRKTKLTKPPKEKKPSKKALKAIEDAVKEAEAKAAKPPKVPHAECWKCPAYGGKLVGSVRALPTEAGRVKLTIVGEAPIAADSRDGGIDKGPSGRILAGIISRSESPVPWDQIHYTNAVLCECRHKHRKAAIAACAPRLRAEIEAARPQGIIAIGDATSVVLGRSKAPILKWRGTVNPQGDSYVVPIMSPIDCRRAQRWQPILERDIQRALRVAEYGWQAPEDKDGRRLIIARTITELHAALSLLEPARFIGFDVETVGLGPTETALVCYGLSDGQTTVVIPWATRDGRMQWWADGGAQVAELTSELFASRVVVTHNGPNFDHIVAARYGIKIAQWDDTLNMAHVTDSHLPKGLAFVVSQTVDVGPWKLLEDRTADMDRLFVYNGRDTLYMMLHYLKVRDLTCS